MSVCPQEKPINVKTHPVRTTHQAWCSSVSRDTASSSAELIQRERHKAPISLTHTKTLSFCCLSPTCPLLQSLFFMSSFTHKCTAPHCWLGPYLGTVNNCLSEVMFAKIPRVPFSEQPLLFSAMIMGRPCRIFSKKPVRNSHNYQLFYRIIIKSF